LAKDKAQQLDTLQRKLESLENLPLYGHRQENQYKLVFGKGSPDARIMFIGEAPGKHEALKGEPFVGAAGRVLDQLLRSIGLERGQVYITNILKDRPPENRDPRTDEITQYVPFLRQQIEIIQPKVIVTLGRFAMEFIFREFNMPEQGGSITALHGKRLRTHADYGEITVLPLFHPAVTFYRREQRQILENDFQALRADLGK
jgi:DNA polymerase